MGTSVEVSMNPVLFTAISGQRYAVSGSVWIPVPSDTTRDDLPRYMTWKAPSAPEIVPEQRWTVTGSKGDTYTVRSLDGQWSCSCPGFGFRRKCRHITEIKNESR